MGEHQLSALAKKLMGNIWPLPKSRFVSIIIYAYYCIATMILFASLYR